MSNESDPLSRLTKHNPPLTKTETLLMRRVSLLKGLGIHHGSSAKGPAPPTIQEEGSSAPPSVSTTTTTNNNDGSGSNLTNNSGSSSSGLNNNNSNNNNASSNVVPGAADGGSGSAVFSEGSFVFIPDKVHCFLPARVCSTFIQGQEGLIAFVPLNGGDIPSDVVAKKMVKVIDTSGFMPMDEQSLQPLPNMVDLKQLNDASLLHNLRMRFLRDEIYSQIGTILVSLNPFKLLPIYTPQIMEKYLRLGSRRNPPHIYGIADNAYRQMVERQMSQSCIVSGESGAGKTEATKLFLGYIAEASSQGDDATGVGSIQQQVLEANPLMEAFGNAKTSRNDNSSRFGKWISVTFNNKKGNIIGASITQYLLEKSRVVFHSSGERNYHIFYQLCAAASIDTKIAQAYRIKNVESYAYLNHNPVEVFVVNGTDDYKEWEHTIRAMNVIGIPEDKQMDVIRSVAGILHLGNIRFEKIEMAGKDARAGIENMDMVEIAAEQLGSTVEALTLALTKKNVGVGREVLLSEYSVEAARDARDALAKTIFGKMFEWLTTRINESLASGATVSGKAVTEEDRTLIGVLDIFGFESFEHNSFEQLCINYCNEKLQGFFNDHIFKQEQAEYEAEGVDVSKIGFVDNQAVLDAIESKPSGLLAQLDEELITPRGSDEGFLRKLFGTGKSMAQGAPRGLRTDSMGSQVSTASAPRPTRTESSGHGKIPPSPAVAGGGTSECIKKPDIRLVREKPILSQCFIVVHYAGEVTYNVSGFLTKNKDSLIDDLEQIGSKSSIEFIRDLFVVAPPANSGDEFSVFESSGGRATTTSRKTAAGGKRSLGAQFKEQLASLMKTLRSTEPHFVRCVKSNPEKRGNTFGAQMVLDQLRYSGLMEVTRIRKLGYPVRKSFNEFVDRYSPLCPGLGRKGELEKLLKHLTGTELLFGSDWQVGKTKVFMRQGLFNGLETAREKIFGISVTRIQKIARGYIARFRYRKYKKILTDLSMAIAQSNEANLEASLLAVGELPHNGRHISIVDDAKKLLDKLQAERKVLALVKDASDARDLPLLESSTEAALELGLGPRKEIKAALQLLDLIRKERMVRDALRAAMENEDKTNRSLMIKAIEEALGHAEKFGLLGLPEAKVAISKRDRILAEDREVASLQDAISRNDIAQMTLHVASLIEMGLDSHPLIAVAEKITQKHQEESAERARQVAHVERELQNATRARDIDALNALYPDIIRLGLTGPTVKHALVLREMITFEKDAFEHIEAEIKTVRVKADSYEGITRHDLASLTKSITKVKTKGFAEHPKLIEAVEFQTRMVKQLVVQEQLKQALRDKSSVVLKKAAEKATALGMQTNVAKRVFAEVRTLQKQKAAARERKRSVDTGTAPKIGQASNGAQLASKIVSKAHMERVTKAQSEIYDFTKFFEIRSDEDFTQFDVQMMKKHKAEHKLRFQKSPLTRSILACNQELNQNAIRNHRSLMGWCGDSNSTFRATLAHDILTRGIEVPELVDEIYIQICKHLVENPRKESIEAAWLLMCMITKTFAPSENFLLYLLNFITRRRHEHGIIGNYARLCVYQLDGTIENGPSWQSPTLEDVQLYEMRPPVLATVHMVDGTTMDLSVPPEMTVAQAAEIIANSQKVAPTEIHKMGIFVTPRSFITHTDPNVEAKPETQQGNAPAVVGGEQNSIALGPRMVDAEGVAAVDSILAAVNSRPTVVGIGSLRNTVAPSSAVSKPSRPPSPDSDDELDKVVPRRTVVGAHSSPVSNSKSPKLSKIHYGDDTSKQDDEFREPPVPHTPWPLPSMVYLGDIYLRMSNQGKEPIFSFKKKLFFELKNDPKPDRLLYYQLVQDIVSGALPVPDEATVIGLVSCSIAAKMGKLPDDPNKLIEEDLMSFIPLPWYERKTEEAWAKSVLKVAEVMVELSASQLRDRYIATCRDNQLYGMSLFYGYREGDRNDMVLGVNYKGIHMLDINTFEITASIPYKAIQKFGATPTFLWFTVVNKKVVSVMNIYSVQTAEAFGLIHDYTHWNMVHMQRPRPDQAAATRRRSSLLAGAATVANRVIKGVTSERT